MTALFNPSPLVLGTLQNLSLVLDRSTALSRSQGVSGLAVGRSEARAFGGLDMTIQRTGQSMPAKVRYGAITIAPRAQGSAYSKSPGVHPAIDRAYDNPGVRFGDRVKGGERPVSAAGETSCHFSQTSVSKTSPIREMIKAARGGRRLTGSRAAAHVLYVEREGAPEQIKKPGEERLQGEAFTAEIVRRGLDRSAVAQQAYIERAGAAEGIERKPGRSITDEELDALDEASFGTIGNTVEERTRFWLAVEEAEATPKGDRITIKPRENPEWWSRVAEAVNSAPSAAQEPIRDALARDDGEPFDLKLPTDKAFALHQWAVDLDTEAPLEISPGRGGRTQTRVIAELPHELDGRERLQIVRDFTRKLAEKGFPYWAVIHAPDANNDARNYHVHVAYYDRPAAKISAPSGTGEVWDFEIQDYVTYKSKNGGAKRHLTRPYQQNRDRSTHDREWVTELRKHWETVSNRVLEDAGISKRYNLSTYESMGIDLEPLKHINSRTFNKERKGELTEEGPVLARRQWDNVHDRMVRDHETRARRRQASIENLGDYAARLVAPQPYGEHRVAEVKRLREMGIKASYQLALAELHQDLTRLVSDRVASRPKLIMNAADKEEQKAQKKKGLPADAPPEDHSVAGAALFGLSRRSEVLKFLTTIYDGALLIDRDNDQRSRRARNNVRLIVQELKAWVAQPGRSPHLARRYSDEPLQGLDDPARLERREAMREALARGFGDAAEQANRQILDQIKTTAARQNPTAVPDPARPRTTVPTPTERTAPSGAGPSTGARPDPRPAPAAAIPAQPPEKPRYRPGRPGGEPRTSDRAADRPSRGRPVLDPAQIQSMWEPSASARRSAATPSQAGRADRVSPRPASQGALGTPSTGAANEPEPPTSRTVEQAISTAVRRVDDSGARTPVAPDPRRDTVQPPTLMSSQSSLEPEDSAAVAVQSLAAKPSDTERSAGLSSSRSVEAKTIAAAFDAAARAEPVTRPPAAKIEASASVSPADVDGLGMSSTHSAEPAPAPAQISQPETAAELTLSAEARALASTHTDAGDGDAKPSLSTSETDPRSGARDFRTPAPADVLEERESVRLSRAKSANEDEPPIAVATKRVELTEVQIVGAQRPPKKRRERQRDRGRER